MAEFLASLADGSHPVEPGRLTWFDAYGCGYYPIKQSEAPYDEAYFARYAGMANTEMGQALNVTRARMVERWWQGDLVDIGIGSGSFIEHRPDTWGYDVNPTAVLWLRRNKRWWNPRVDPCPAVSMWDVLEHMPDFPKVLANVRAYVFVALPVFDGPGQALASRHYRPTEHCWYFTSFGFIQAMSDLGWRWLETNWNESLLGRERIASFAFRRIAAVP